MLKLTISRDDLIFGALVINSRRDSYSSVGCLATTNKKKRNPVIGIASWSCPQTSEEKGR